MQDINSVAVEFIDYAQNYSFWSLKSLTDKVGAYIDDVTTMKGMTSATVSVRNNTEEDITADVIIAFYDKDSRLIAMASKEDYTIKKSGEKITYSMLADTSKAVEAKVFVWEPNAVTPKDTEKSFKIAYDAEEKSFEITE